MSLAAQSSASLRVMPYWAAAFWTTNAFSSSVSSPPLTALLKQSARLGIFLWSDYSKTFGRVRSIATRGNLKNCNRIEQAIGFPAPDVENMFARCQCPRLIGKLGIAGISSSTPRNITSLDARGKWEDIPDGCGNNRLLVEIYEDRRIVESRRIHIHRHAIVACCGDCHTIARPSTLTWDEGLGALRDYACGHREGAFHQSRFGLKTEPRHQRDSNGRRS